LPVLTASYAYPARKTGIFIDFEEQLPICAKLDRRLYNFYQQLLVFILACLEKKVYALSVFTVSVAEY